MGPLGRTSGRVNALLWTGEGALQRRGQRVLYGRQCPVAGPAALDPRVVGDSLVRPPGQLLHVQGLLSAKGAGQHEDDNRIGHPGGHGGGVGV